MSRKASFKETVISSRKAYGLMHREFPGLISSMTCAYAFNAALPYIAIWFSAQIINELAGLRRPQVLWPLVLASLGSALILGIIHQVLHTWNVKMQNRFIFSRQKVYTDKLLSMDYEDVDKAEVRSLLDKIRGNENWSNWGMYVLMNVLEYAVTGIAGILGAVALTVSLFVHRVPQGNLVILNHPVFILLFVGALVLATQFSAFCHNKSSESHAALSEEATFGNRLCNYMLLSERPKAAADVRLYNQQKISMWYLEQDKTFLPGGPYAKCAAGPMGTWAAVGACTDALRVGMVYVFVCFKAWAGAFGVGSIMQYVGAVTALSRNLSQLMKGLGLLRSNVPFMEDIYTFLDVPNRMYQGSLTTEKRADRQYQVEFKDVSFKYPGSDTWSLRHVNMKFKVGSRLAVVGENGSGKTTFIKLLCRLYDPQEGQILLNGIDIRKYKYDDYIGIFSVVFQDFQLVSQPLGANVAGRMDYDRARAEQALRDAGFGNRLDTMPQGLDTVLYKDFGEAGVEVSGGEAQKIAIARALYKDAPFIILDEPTAALDPIAEAEIYSKFNEISGDRTAIYISHRLSSCKFCDEILVFSQGGVIQQGAHEALLAEADGKYAQLWNAQAQYYTENPSCATSNGAVG